MRIIRQKPRAETRYRLFCFPFAGGGASTYRDWPDQFTPAVEVCSVQMPGREDLLTQPPFTQMTTLVESLVRALTPILDRPFAFFGHSMGALVSFALTRHLRRSGLPLPAHLFLSGCRPPHLPPRRAPRHALPDAELIEQIRDYNGTPEEVLQHPELMALILPLLRADFAVCENYKPEHEEPLSIPLSVYGGLEDSSVPQGDWRHWQDVSDQPATFTMFAGGHFFLNTSRPMLLRTVSAELNRLLARR